jgi:hypothetical protein
MTTEPLDLEAIEARRQLAIRGYGHEEHVLVHEDIPQLLDRVRAQDELIAELKSRTPHHGEICQRADERINALEDALREVVLVCDDHDVGFTALDKARSLLTTRTPEKSHLEGYLDEIMRTPESEK